MSNRYRRALVILSGGQDSTTCLYLAKQVADEVHAITFNYRQRHILEIAAATNIAAMAQVKSHEVIDLGDAVLKGTSPLVSQSTPLEQYANAAALPGGIEKTFVPMRNALFLVIAANRAAVLNCEAIYIGVSQEDYGGYPDCREPFVNAMQITIEQALSESVQHLPILEAPLMFLNKAETVDLAMGLPGCMEALAYSHTCYAGEFPPCGKCHACLLRDKGFEIAGVRDPLRDRAEMTDA